MDQRHFLELLLKYLVRFEFLSDSTGNIDEKEEYRPQIIKLIMNLFLKELKVSEEVGDNMIYISWILYSYQYLNKLEMVEFLCRYLELFPPAGYIINGEPKEGNSFETDVNPLNTSFSRSPYSPSHHLIWKMLASVLGPLAPEDRLLNQSVVAQHCEITGFVKNSVLVNKSFVDLRKDTNIPIKSESSATKVKTELENAASETKNLKINLSTRKELWQSTVLSGSMLNDFTSSVLPFECEELIQSFSAAETLTNSTTSSSSVQLPSIPFSQFPEILLNEELTEDNFSLLEEDLLRAPHLLAVCEKVFHSANSQAAPMSSQMNSQTYFSQSAAAENVDDENNMEGRNQFVSLLHSQLSVLRNLKEEKDESNPSSGGEVSSSSSAERISLPKPLLFKALLHFLYHRRSISFLRDFTEFLQQNEEAKSQDANYLIEKVQVSLRTASFFGLQNDSRKWKKEIQRNHTRETIFILGKRLLELLSFQILIAAHMLTQDCFLATRGIQLLFQHYLYYANKLKEIEAKTTKASENSSSSGWVTEDGATTDLSPIIRQQRDHVLQCLSFLHQNGINLSRAIKLAFDWGTRNISMTTSPPQYFLVDENNELKSGSSSYKAYYHK
jgi:hypothetical protein